jgi:GMC oxidoreductase
MIAGGRHVSTARCYLDPGPQPPELTYRERSEMGSDPMAVVDTQLRVMALRACGVADASIMPTLTSGNTNAPSIIIGEKAADMVLSAAT